MPTSLPNVTLAVVDSVACDLSYMAIRDTLREIVPKEVLIFSDQAEPFNEFSDSVVKIDPLRSLDHVGRVIWQEIPAFATTSHVLLIQYDGWVIDGSKWDDDWLYYDYIGAPWPWHSEKKVGNGGFSLRSTRFMKHLAVNRQQYPFKSPEDDAICREYGDSLENDGILFAPEEVAENFAFERSFPRESFGFHGLFNFRSVLNDTGLRERIVSANEYIREKPEWRELLASRW